MWDNILLEETRFALESGAYKWRVRAYVSDAWSAWSTYMKFFRSAPAFDSKFEGTMDGWARMAGGSWSIYNNHHLYTSGLYRKYSSAYNTSGVFSDFDYKAMMFRIGKDPNYLAVRMGSSVGEADRWYPGYLFGYNNVGQFGIFKLGTANGIYPLKNWTASPAIKKDNWNILRVVAKGANFKFYINGVLLYLLNDATYPSGFVGVMTYLSTESTTKSIVIDYATLTPILTPQ